MKWSHYQQGVFDFVINGKGHGCTEAVPGSGKTTVIEEAIRRIDDSKSILAVAFNRHIKVELAERLDLLPNVTVVTLNGFGFAQVRNGMPGYHRVDGNKTEKTLKWDTIRSNKNTYHLPKEEFKLWARIRRPVSQIIGLLKANLVFKIREVKRKIPEIIDDFNIIVPDDIDIVNLVIRTYDRCLEKTEIIDFDDQIIYPLFHDLKIETFDFVFVDEAQDLSPAQIELTKRATNGGRAIYVGDRNQAIYQFRGADSYAIENIITEMDCMELPLSICYRCGKAIVEEAKKLVPQIESFEGAPDGLVATISEKEFFLAADKKDAVLCRTTAPLISAALTFIRSGKKAVVKGREIGDNLKAMISQINEQTIPEFLEALFCYAETQNARLSKLNKEAQLIVLQDTIDTLNVLAEKADTVNDLIDKIDKIFDDKQQNCISLMTVHKAKGLEADRIFILRPDLLPHPIASNEEAMIAEKNIKLVAITRAKKELYWVKPHEST